MNKFLTKDEMKQQIGTTWVPCDGMKREVLLIAFLPNEDIRYCDDEGVYEKDWWHFQVRYEPKGT